LLCGFFEEIPADLEVIKLGSGVSRIVREVAGVC